MRKGARLFFSFLIFLILRHYSFFTLHGLAMIPLCNVCIYSSTGPQKLFFSLLVWHWAYLGFGPECTLLRGYELNDLLANGWP